MRMFLKAATAALFAGSLAACVTITPAPGSERVKVTENPADVASCKSVGNIDAVKYNGDQAIMRNEVIGDGGDTLLLTVPAAFGGGLGVAYRCSKD